MATNKPEKSSKEKVTKKKAVKKKAVKKKAVKKKAVKKKAVPKNTAKKTKPEKSKKAKKTTVISDSEKRMMIAMHAYLKWEEAGFPHGEDYQHWIEAEEEVEAMLK